LYSIFLIEPQS